MSKWLDGFEVITSSVRVDGDDRAHHEDEHYPCQCKPEFPGGPICVDRSCLNYCMQVECIKCKPGCQNNSIQKKKYAKLDVRETPGKGFGLFACEDIKKGQFLMEYLGELVSAAELTTRMDAARLDRHLYVLQVKTGNFLDARMKGSIGRFINHSCEPNCVTELWTVDERIRVGIFACKDIEKDTELTFDYKWTPSNRPPTKCHCGTASCRGFLELMTQQEIDESKVRKGVWRNKKDDLAAIKVLKMASTSSLVTISEDGDEISGTPRKYPNGFSSASGNYIFDDNGRLIPQKMLHKRVRIWWEGNQAYFEAEVMDYLEKTNRYVCYYIVDETTVEENLSDLKSDWFWLDETQEEVIIKKKEIPVFIEADVVEEEEEGKNRLADAITETPRRSSSGSLTAPGSIGNGSAASVYGGGSSGGVGGSAEKRAMPAFVQTSRGVVKVQFQTALQVVNVARTLNEEQQRQRLTVWNHLFSLLKEFYQVEAQFAMNDKAPDFLDVLEQRDSQQIVLIGGEELVKRAKEGLITAHETYLAQRMNEDQHRREEQYNRQSVMLTNDWRLMPTLSTNGTGSHRSNGSGGGRRQAPVSQLAQQALSLLTEMSFDSGAAHLAAQSLLPKTPLSASVEQEGPVEMSLAEASAAAAAAASGCMSERVHQTLLQNHQGLVRRLSYSQSVSYGSLCLLIRYLRFCDDRIAKDATSLIAAVVVLALKGKGLFKVRMLNKLVRSAYCQVFGRQESEVGSSADTFIPKVVEYETLIQTKLFGDVFVPDVDDLLHASAYLQVQEEVKSRETESVVDVNDRHHKHHKRSSHDSGASALVSARKALSDLLDEGLKLACILMCSHSSLLIVLPSDILQLSCLIVVSLMDTLLTPNSILRYMMITSKETPGPLLTSLLTIAAQSADVVSKSIEVVVSIISKNLASIHGVKCLTLKDKFETTPIATLLVECLPKLFARWLRQVQETKHSMSSATVAAVAPPVPPVVGQFRPSVPATATTNTASKTPAVKPVSGLGYKTRLPWITEDTVPRSHLQLSDISDLTLLSKEGPYSGMASIEGVLRLNAGHVVNHVGFVQQSVEAMPVTLQPWPTLKTLIRDIKKSAVSHPSELGTTNGAMSELCLLQHLHYHYQGPASNQQSTPRQPAVPSVSCPYFVEPFGILTIPASEWHQPATSQLLFGNKFDANHEYFESLRDTESAVATVSTYTSSSVYSSSGVTTHASDSSDYNYNSSSGGGGGSNSSSRNMLALLQDDSRHTSLVASQLSALKDKKYALPETSLSFLVLAPIQLVLSSVLGSSHAVDSGSLSLQLCKDLLCAADHMIHCGVYLKFLSLDHLFVSAEGRLQIGSLAGAVSSFSPEAFVGTAAEAAERESSSSRSHKESKEHRSKSVMETVSSSSWYTVAPEVLLGSAVSPDTTLYTVGSVICHILTGKTLIKNTSSEEKLLQYIYRVLGTPKVVGYTDFDQLPLASTYGSQIRVDDGSMSESRPRVFKVTKGLCSPPLLSQHSFQSTISTSAAADSEESDGGGVVDLIRQAVHLVPSRRIQPSALLSLRVFHSVLSAAQTNRCSVEQYSKGEWISETLFLSNNVSVVVQCMAPQSRMSAVSQLVQKIHRNNQKEQQRNQMLVKLATEQYPEQPTAVPVAASNTNGVPNSVWSRGGGDYSTPRRNQYPGEGIERNQYGKRPSEPLASGISNGNVVSHSSYNGNGGNGCYQFPYSDKIPRHYGSS